MKSLYNPEINKMDGKEQNHKDHLDAWFPAMESMKYGIQVFQCFVEPWISLKRIPRNPH